MSCNEWKETEIGKIPAHWDFAPMKDYVEINMGQSPKSEFYNTTGEGLPFLQGNRTFGMKYPYYDTYSSNIKKVAQEGDILFSVRAPVGDVNIATEEFCIGRGIASLRMKNGNQEYLYYLLREYRKYIENRESGTVFGSINKKGLEELKLPFPPKEEQEKIANILSSLDNKIELNNEMNKNLEKMAQSIFKRWFVDFEFLNEEGQPYKSSGGEMVDSELGMIPKGWEVKTIEDLCEVGSSKRIFMKEYVDSGIPFYRGKEIIEKSKGNSISTELFITKERFEEIKEKFGVPNKNDILLTSVGTLGVAYLVDDEEFYFKDGNLTWFKNFKEEVYRYFIYQWIISSEGKKSIDAITIGSTQKALTINALKGMKLVLPSNDILSLFEGFIKSNINNIRSNNEEKNNLIDIRDSLLPKLMSGEINLSK